VLPLQPVALTTSSNRCSLGSTQHCDHCVLLWLVRNPGATVAHLPCQLPLTIRPEGSASASSLGGQPLPAFLSPEPTRSWRMTNRFGIYLCRGTCRSDEVCRKGNWPVVAIADRCWPCLACVTGQARTWGDYAFFPGVVAAQPTPRLENRRLGFEPLRQRKQSSFDTGALADRPAATLSCFDSPAILVSTILSTWPLLRLVRD